ncbi:4-hydroxythreonine-4-phosphate dehydrogenase PdxA [Pikeienuella piscinae]|uniref:4-hydroxythreonine-4-phosphate dehydrogenase PdxA n=1 Tax=Pikeienuella piscinae TaxID=2748098 RepID=UPI003CCC97D4
MLTGMGAIPAPVGISEIVPALMTGLVEGQENPLNNIIARKKYEANKYLMMTGHMESVLAVFVNEGAWEAVPVHDRAIIEARIVDAIRLTHMAREAPGVMNPRIGVAALNPHAGDSRNFGPKDDAIIAPAAETAAKRRSNVVGAVPADTIHVRALTGEFDAVLTMYRDQTHWIRSWSHADRRFPVLDSVAGAWHGPGYRRSGNRQGGRDDEGPAARRAPHTSGGPLLSERPQPHSRHSRGGSMRCAAARGDEHRPFLRKRSHWTPGPLNAAAALTRFKP